MSDTTFVGMAAASVTESPAFAPYSRVILRDEDDRAFTAGDDAGCTLEAVCPWATQKMADDLLEQVQGMVYHPVSASGALLDPAAELGDGVTVAGIYAPLGCAETAFDALCASEFAAPGEAELEHEYPYTGPVDRALDRRVSLGKSYYGTRITRQKGLEIVRVGEDGGERARVVLNSDVLAFYNDDGGQALYFDAQAGKYKFTGLLNVSDNFLVDSDGNVTVNGNLNLAGGTITWGANRPGGGISADQCRTLITSSLVSAPNIAGGKFWDIDQAVRIEMGSEHMAAGDIGYMSVLVDGYSETDPMFQVYCRTDALSRGVAMRATGKDFLVIDGTHDMVTPMLTWDFSYTTVKGLTATAVFG